MVQLPSLGINLFKRHGSSIVNAYRLNIMCYALKTDTLHTTVQFGTEQQLGQSVLAVGDERSPT